MRNKLSWGSKHSVLPRLSQSRSHGFLVWCGRTRHQRLLSLAARQIYRWKISPVMLSNQRQPYQTTRQSNRSRAQDPVWIRKKLDFWSCSLCFRLFRAQRKTGSVFCLLSCCATGRPYEGPSCLFSYLRDIGCFSWSRLHEGTSKRNFGRKIRAGIWKPRSSIELPPKHFSWKTQEKP